MTETFTPEEIAVLQPYVTNVDRPIFALKNLPEYGYIHCLCREADYVHRHKRSSSHGVNIAQGIRDGDLAECVRIVHDGCKKIHRLDNGQVVSKLINTGIIQRIHTPDNIGVGQDG